MAIGEEHNRLAEYFASLNIEEPQRPIGGQNLNVQRQDLIAHAAGCHSPDCHRRNCRNVKVIFSHVLTCGKRCDLCEKLWSIFQLHARACRESNCVVPRCRDVKEYLQQQQPRRGADGRS